ncbi:MAG: TraB/GumN family protein [Chitinophagaceae bacterium]|nr:TraB/GumN family protein [Chitinophagaceae bacterium]
MKIKSRIITAIITIISISAYPQKSLLWEISGNGLTQPSYLYGTMHMVCAEKAQLSEGLKNAIKASKEVFFEIDMDDMNEMMGALKYARMTNGLKINDLVSPEEYNRLDAYFKQNKSPLPLSMMAGFKPYFITAMIAEGIIKCSKKTSLEQIIMEEAKKDDKSISGLESIEFQASLFDSIPYEKQAQDLVMYVDSIESFKKLTDETIAMYYKQDIDSMDSLMIKSDPGTAQFMDLLLYNRNLRWADQIPEQAFKTSTLFAVGAGHLGGEKGVINLLRKKGFTLKPLKN